MFALLQGGLEISCSVTLSMPGTIRNHLLLDWNREPVTDLYCENKDGVITGIFCHQPNNVQ